MHPNDDRLAHVLPRVPEAVRKSALLQMVWRLVPESRASSARRPDRGGIGLCAVGLFALVYGISQASGPAGPFSLAVGAPVLIAVVFLSASRWGCSRAALRRGC